MTDDGQGRFWIATGMACMVLVAGWAEGALSEVKYPTRAIEIIVPFTAGGGTDLSTRLTASYVSKKWGVPVNIVNKPGGNTIPANVELYRAAGDGYTLMGEASTVCYLEVKKLPFIVMDRTFIVITNIGPQVLYVPSSTPYRSLKELAAAIQEKPEQFSWVSRGGPDPADYQIRQFLIAAAVDFRKTKAILSQGASQGMTLVAGGHAMLGSGSSSSVLPALKAGTIRPLAVSGNVRYADLPDVPTAAEAGYPTATVDNWFGITGPPSVPSYVVAAWDSAVQEMLRDPEVVAKLKNIAQMPFYYNSRQMADMVRTVSAEAKKLWSEP